MPLLQRCTKYCLPVAVLALFALLPTPGHAALLWYNGDYDTNDAYTNQYNVPINNGSGYTLNRSLVYSDFVVGPNQTWTLSSVFSNNQIAYGGTPSQAHYEIRTGMSAGNGGQVIASGDATATYTQTHPADGNNYFAAEYQVSVNLSGITLNPGVYYLAVAPTSVGYYGDQSYLETTSGANAVGTPPGNNGNSFLYNNETGSSQNNYVASALDFSMGVNGTVNQLTVPEPASWVLLAAGGAILAGPCRRFTRPGRRLG